jgi:NADH-quinone oxidoreductase subunit L
MVIGTLAITGVGVAGVSASPASIRRTRSSRRLRERQRSGRGRLLPRRARGALLTSFYSWRLIFLTFYGKPRWAQSEHIQHALHGGS